jgi:transposase
MDVDVEGTAQMLNLLFWRIAEAPHLDGDRAIQVVTRLMMHSLFEDSAFLPSAAAKCDKLDTVQREELSDADWCKLAPLLPSNPRRSRRYKDHRRVISGILWRLRTGAPWHDIPSAFGPWQTLYDRFVRWRRDGTWLRILKPCKLKQTSKAVSTGKVQHWTLLIYAHTEVPPVPDIYQPAWKRLVPGRASSSVTHEGDGPASFIFVRRQGQTVSVVVTVGQRSEGTQLGMCLMQYASHALAAVA